MTRNVQSDEVSRDDGKTDEKRLGEEEHAAIMRKLSLTLAVADIRRGNDPRRATGPDDVADTRDRKCYGRKAAVAQLLATIVQSLLLVNVGMELAMSTIVIGALYKKPHAEFALTESESSWYGSILYLCQPVGSCLSGYAQKYYGKKSCVVLACLPSIVGWTILRYADSVDMLYLSTVTMGLGLGFNDGPAYSYIGEVCEPRLRGIMSCVVNMACLIGILSTYGLGFACHWKTVASLSALCPVLCLLLVAFIPESPIWLLSKGKNEKAMRAICWLRGWVDPCVVAAEFQELMFYYKTSVEQARSTKESSTGVFSSFVWIKQPSVYRPLRLATVYYTVTLISCLTPCRPYVVDLMKESGVNIDTQNIALVLFGAMQLSGSLVLTFTVRRLGKRLLTLTSLTVNALAILMFGVYTVSIDRHVASPAAYVPMVLYSVILFSGAMGVLTVPWTLVSEVYPNEAKGFASSLTTAIFYMLTFATTKLYLTVQDALGLANTFFVLTASSLLGLVYLYKYMPETENKTLMEIENFFVPRTDNALQPPSGP